MNLSYICIVLYQYNTHNGSGMDISSVDFPSISEVILSLWVSQIMTSLGPLSGLFFSKLLYAQNFFLPLSQHCHSKKSMSLSVSVSHHSFWGKQAAMSEAALCKWPCDKDARPPANSQQETKDCQHPWECGGRASGLSGASIWLTAVAPGSLTDTSWEILG